MLRLGFWSLIWAKMMIFTKLFDFETINLDTVFMTDIFNVLALFRDNNNENIDIELIENILSDNIDNDYINSPIIHIFPIIFSTSITLLFAAYLLLQ